MTLAEFLLGNLSFAYAFHLVQPAKIVDGIIKVVVDVLTPGKGAGENNWLMKGLRAFEMQADKTSREYDIRVNLRRWDEEFPWMHHELIIRYLAGFLSSSIVLAVYRDLRGRGGRYSYNRKYD